MSLTKQLHFVRGTKGYYDQGVEHLEGQLPMFYLEIMVVPNYYHMASEVGTRNCRSPIGVMRIVNIELDRIMRRAWGVGNRKIK